jgi:hypothetical protein
MEEMNGTEQDDLLNVFFNGTKKEKMKSIYLE